MFKDFKKFILRGNVVDLAVAVVIGAAFTSVINSLVNGFITPLITGITGGKGSVQGTFHFELLNHTFTFDWGLILSALISFLIIAAVVFFFVVQPINKLMTHMKPSEEVDSPAERECPECLSGIPAAATRCKFCTARSKPSKETA